jgi:hypothetical protein
MDRYTHLNVLDVTGPLDRLPSLPASKKTSDGQEEVRHRA